MQSGRLKLIIEKIDMLAELEEAFLMYSERARRENIELDFDEQLEAAIVFADKNRLRQVFINIIRLSQIVVLLGANLRVIFIRLHPQLAADVHGPKMPPRQI